MERYFTRRVAIPNGIQKNTIQCSVDDQGHLHICGTQAAKATKSHGSKARRAIPIGAYDQPSGSQQAQRE